MCASTYKLLAFRAMVFQHSGVLGLIPEQMKEGYFLMFVCFVSCLEMTSLHVAQADCLSLPHAGIIGICCHTQSN